MAKQTLLDIVQSILNDMDGDEVSSIADTVEATQAAQIVKDTFFEIMGSRHWPHLDKLIQLNSGTAGTLPTHMSTVDSWNEVSWIKYNVRDSEDTDDMYQDIMYLTPKEFTDLTNQRKSSATNVTTVIDSGSLKLLILNDVRPHYWTTFDDEVLVFDSYDSAIETNLQQSKTQCWGNVEATWVHTDTAIPDLPAKAFAYLLSEAKSTAFNVLRQTGNAKEEQKSRRQRVYLARDKWRVAGGMQFPNYGRK